MAPKGTRLFSRGKLRRSFMGNTREQEFLQAQQPVPNAAVEPEYKKSGYASEKRGENLENLAKAKVL